MSARLIDLSSFERLQRRYRVRGTLVVRNGLRIGGGKSFEAAATDQRVMRDALGRPFIPGSSLKGVLRSALEAVLRGLKRDDFSACDLFDDTLRCTAALETKQRESKGSVKTEDILAALCTVCGLFGSSFLAGRVFVADLPYTGEGSLRTEVRDGVGIDRDLHVASRAIKYDFELVPAGTSFALELVLENVGDLQLALVLQALELLDQGHVLLGGLTTRGLGRVGLEALTLETTTPELLLTGKGFEPLDYRERQQELVEVLASRLWPTAGSVQEGV